MWVSLHERKVASHQVSFVKQAWHQLLTAFLLSIASNAVKDRVFHGQLIWVKVYNHNGTVALVWVTTEAKQCHWEVVYMCYPRSCISELPWSPFVVYKIVDLRRYKHSHEHRVLIDFIHHRSSPHLKITSHISGVWEGGVRLVSPDRDVERLSVWTASNFWLTHHHTGLEVHRQPHLTTIFTCGVTLSVAKVH